MRADALDPRREAGVGAMQRLHTHRTRHIGRAQHHFEVGDGETQVGQHAFRAVEQCQSFLGGQLHR